jgi:hypothetical protein|tara:strand:+ start:1316 stop:1489 length:174 start_codon:yes stop_codon:yes gene_type:complete
MGVSMNKVAKETHLQFIEASIRAAINASKFANNKEQTLKLQQALDYFYRVKSQLLES